LGDERTRRRGRWGGREGEERRKMEGEGGGREDKEKREMEGKRGRGRGERWIERGEEEERGRQRVKDRGRHLQHFQKVLVFSSADVPFLKCQTQAQSGRKMGYCV